MKKTGVILTKIGGFQAAFLRFRQPEIAIYRAPNPVKIIRMVLNAMSKSSENEKCLM